MPPSVTLPKDRTRNNFPIRSRERRQGPGNRMGVSCLSVDPPDLASPEKFFPMVESDPPVGTSTILWATWLGDELLRTAVRKPWLAAEALGPWQSPEEVEGFLRPGHPNARKTHGVRGDNSAA
jgi:hypothetical protein